MKQSLSSLYRWYDHTLFFGYLPNIESHSHHALQIQIGLYEEFKINSGKESVSCRLALIPPDEAHRIDDCSYFQTVIYIEPESVMGRRLKPIYKKGQVEVLSFDAIKPFIKTLRSFTEKIQDCNEAQLILQAILGALSKQDFEFNELDERIKTVLDICKKSPDKKISTKELAENVGLSEGRLIHLFKDQIGVPVRRYLLWTRLSDALLHLSKGGSFTEAAYFAGFSDSAHLSRTYRRMYGNSLYDLVRNSQFVQAIPCFV